MEFFILTCTFCFIQGLYFLYKEVQGVKIRSIIVVVVVIIINVFKNHKKQIKNVFFPLELFCVYQHLNNSPRFFIIIICQKICMS